MSADPDAVGRVQGDGAARHEPAPRAEGLHGTGLHGTGPHAQEPHAQGPQPRRRHGHASHLNRRLSVLLLALVVGLVPWTVLLGMTLPPHYHARNWPVVWIGFDAALIAVLSYTAWAVWFRRQIMVVTAIVAGTLLASDAWFDAVTSFGNRDEWLTLATALAVEAPLALLFFWLATRIIKRTYAAFYEAAHLGGEAPVHLSATPVLFTMVRRADAPGEGAGAAPALATSAVTGARPGVAAGVEASRAGSGAVAPRPGPEKAGIGVRTAER